MDGGRILDGLTQVIRKLRENGVSILLAEQNARFALSCCEKCYIMEKGNVIYSADVENITSEVLQTYMGA